MHDIYVNDVVRLCQGKVLYGDEKLKLSTFCTDTRTLNEGDVYVGICGERVDGNDFYKEAFQRGASCFILSKEPKERLDGVTVIDIAVATGDVFQLVLDHVLVFHNL